MGISRWIEVILWNFNPNNGLLFAVSHWPSINIWRFLGLTDPRIFLFYRKQTQILGSVYWSGICDRFSGGFSSRYFFCSRLGNKSSNSDSLKLLNNCIPEPNKSSLYCRVTFGAHFSNFKLKNPINYWIWILSNKNCISLYTNFLANPFTCGFGRNWTQILNISRFEMAPSNSCNTLSSLKYWTTFSRAFQFNKTWKLTLDIACVASHKHAYVYYSDVLIKEMWQNETIKLWNFYSRSINRCY